MAIPTHLSKLSLHSLEIALNWSNAIPLTFLTRLFSRCHRISVSSIKKHADNWMIRGDTNQFFEHKGEMDRKVSCPSHHLAAPEEQCNDRFACEDALKGIRNLSLYAQDIVFNRDHCFCPINCQPKERYERGRRQTPIWPCTSQDFEKRNYYPSSQKARRDRRSMD